MDLVENWLMDGEKNKKSFFVEEENGSSVVVSLDGDATFSMSLAHPFTVTTRSTRYMHIVAVNELHLSSLAAVLDHITLLCGGAEANDDDNEEDAQDYHVDYDYEDDAPPPKADPHAALRAERMRAALEVETNFDTSTLSKGAIERIVRDMSALRDAKHEGWCAAPQGRNLATWDIEIFDFDKGSELEKDMAQVAKKTGSNRIHMQMKFPVEYPFKPPFLRVVKPRFQYRTGRVTVGGSICTEVLTDGGWRPIFDVESLIITIRSQMIEGSPRVDFSRLGHEYTEGEALEAFHRVAEHHKANGW